MNNLLVTLFAVLDCNVWSIDQVRSRIDQLVRTSEHPKSWLVDLGASKSIDAGLETVRLAMRESHVFLPDDVGDLLAGLILLRLDKGELSPDEARRNLVDVVDAYGTSCVDAEAASRLDLGDAAYSGIRETAAQALSYLCSGRWTATDRQLVEN